jgi:hypothetical protein
MLDSLTVSDSVERETVRTVAKILLGAGALLAVAYLLALLPGVDRLVPRTPVTFAALIGAVVTLAVVALLLAAAPKLASLARMALDGPTDLVENVAGLVYWLVVLVAVLLAHAGLSGALLALFDGAAWLYDVVFLLLALPPVAAVAACLYAIVDPAAEAVADRVAGSDGD